MFKNIKQQKEKNSFPKYEQLENGSLYTFDWNPLQQPILTDRQGIHDWFYIQKQFLTELKGCKVKMYTEVEKGRWHFHGFIKIEDRLLFHIYSIPKLVEYGACNIDIMNTVDDYMRRLIYCNKQQNEMNDFLTSQLYFTLDPKVLAKRNPDGVILISNY